LELPPKTGLGGTWTEIGNACQIGPQKSDKTNSVLVSILHYTEI
jgi:hypothetical protein